MRLRGRKLTPFLLCCVKDTQENGLPFSLYGCGTWILVVTVDHKLNVLKKLLRNYGKNQQRMEEQALLLIVQLLCC